MKIFKTTLMMSRTKMFRKLWTNTLVSSNDGSVNEDDAVELVEEGL